MLSAARAIVRPAASALRARPLAAPSRALKFRPAGVRFLTSTRYSIDHEWVEFDDQSNVGTVGITEYAQKALGDVVFVELPSEGETVAQGDAIGAVESVKAASDIYAPVSGKVVGINPELGDQPGLLNKDPQGKGWLCKVQLSTPAEFETLLNAEAYKAHCEGSTDGGSDA